MDPGTASLRVRPATLADHPRIVDLSARVFAPYGPYGRVVPRWLAHADVEALVAEYDGTFCGTLLLARWVRQGEWTAEILAVAVDEDHRRRGVGAALLEAALARIEGWYGPPSRRVRLHTAADNGPAIALFERFGFADLGEDLGRYEGGQPIVAMGRITSRPSATRGRAPT